MFDGQEKLKPIRAPLQIAREIWLNHAQLYSARCNGGLRSYSEQVGRYFKNAIEYNAGYSYLVWAKETQLNPTAFELVKSARHGLWAFYRGSNPFDAARDANELTQVVGYLTTQTVAEYCAANNLPIVSEIFTIPEVSGTTQAEAAYCNQDGVIVNDYDKYKDYIIPRIVWYYGDLSDRKTTNGINALMIYASDDIVYSDGKTVAGYPFYQNGVEQTAESAYLVYGIPYVDGLDKCKSWRRTKLRAGVLRFDWTETNKDGRHIYLDYNDNLPFKQLGFYLSTVKPYPTSERFPLVNSNNYIGAAGVTARDVLPIYKSAEDVIKLFADFGLTVSTDINDAVTPPEKPDGIINPDNPSDPIDSYPDNTSEDTPIDPAYITPSSFGQSRVYTPVSIRSVLAWICDNTVDISNWSRLFANPADVIQGINIFNLDLVAHDSSRVRFNTATDILGVKTDIANYVLQLGYNNIVNGGSLYLQAYYGNYADYTSMTYQAFLPFVGYISLRACDVVNKTLQLYYAVDFATGSAIAFLNSDNKLVYSGACTVCGKIPISISDKNDQIINNTLTGISGIGSIIGGIASGNVLGAVQGGLNAISSLQLQTNYATRGNMSGSNIYKLLPAFIERTRYDLFLPSGEQAYLGSKYQSWAGAPSTQFATLQECVDSNGYIECDVVVLPSCTATEKEKDEIRALIQRGIYIN